MAHELQCKCDAVAAECLQASCPNQLPFLPSQIARQLRGLPTAFAASLDTQLADLSMEVATVLTKSMQLKEAKTRGAEPPSDASGNAPGTPGKQCRWLVNCALGSI